MGALPELGRAAALMREPGATRVPPTVTQAKKTKQAGQTKRAGWIRGREASARLREEEIPD